MSKLKVDHIFTSESVGEGRPDKLCDRVSDAILDACLEQDPGSRVACETAVTTDFVINLGEITCNGRENINPEAIARKVVQKIGYDRKKLLFCYDNFKYQCLIHPQSCDIAQGVSENEGLFKDHVRAIRA